MDNWTDLDNKQRFDVALKVARRRSREFSKISSNIIGVGAGFRTQGPTNERVLEVCLRFLVKRKWADQRNRRFKIPAKIRAYPKFRANA